MRKRRLLLLPGLLLTAPLPAVCGNQALVSGAYGGTLGAGGSTGAEPSAFGQNPASLRPGRLGAHLHFHRPFGMDELEVAEAGGFLDAAHWGLSVDWRQTGAAGLYAEHGIQVTQALRLGTAGGRFPGVLDLGAAWDGWRAEWPGGKTEMEWNHGLGLAWRMIPRLKIGAFVLGLPLEPGGKSGADRILQWGMEADSRDYAGLDRANRDPGTEAGMRAPLQILRLDFRKTGGTPWRTLASLSLSPHRSLEIAGGFAAPPFQASLGIRISWADWEWHQAFRYHRFLGSTWLSGVGYSHPFSVRD